MTRDMKPPRPKWQHRPMPEDPRELARAMFKVADRKTDEGRQAEKPAAPKGTA